MKTVEEMIRSKTPEEWRKIIDEEMKRLGLKFVKKKGDVDCGHLLPEDFLDIEVNNKK